MRTFNRFQHQSYPTSPAVSPVQTTLEVHEGAPAEFSALHTSLRVGRVIIVHGTFMGNDPVGAVETLQSIGNGVPVLKPLTSQLAEELRRKTQPLTETLTGDIGNYGTAFRDQFQLLVGDDPRVELLEPRWSSQNHHLARADLAVRLVHQMLNRPVPEDQRILLWGHSRAGNAFAILTNLLANEPGSVKQFFEAAGPQAEPHWEIVRTQLAAAPSPHPLARQALVATFETPVRYGWDPLGCAGLVHVIFHRPFDEQRPWFAPPLFPPWSLSDLVNATWGDWVQAFAIAGTDVTSVPASETNRRLAVVLEAGLEAPEHGLDTKFITPPRLRDACARWKFGTRCHTIGRNLLVDYEPSGELTPLRRPLEAAMLGHGVATTVIWLPAHLRLIVEHLQAATVPQG